jgi:hypothetical protein
MTAIHAIEAAIGHAYAIGRVDQSIQVAGEELLRMVAAQPGITPEAILWLCGEEANRPDWDEVLWRLADVWCELQRGLQGRGARQLPPSPHSGIPVSEAAALRPP